MGSGNLQECLQMLEEASGVVERLSLVALLHPPCPSHHCPSLPPDPSLFS